MSLVTPEQFGGGDRELYSRYLAVIEAETRIKASCLEKGWHYDAFGIGPSARACAERARLHAFVHGDRGGGFYIGPQTDQGVHGGGLLCIPEGVGMAGLGGTGADGGGVLHGSTDGLVDAGLSTSGEGGICRGCDSSVRVEERGEPVVSDVKADSVGVGVGPRGGYQRCPRGPNYEKNQANRERKKAAAAARKAGMKLSGPLGESGVASANWRTGGERKGRFDDLGEEVQKELVETQAARLIMENKAKIKEYREREQKQKHGIHHLNEVMKMLRLVKECKKMTDLDPKLKAVVG